MASPLLKYYDFDPKLLLPNGVTELEAANEIKNYYFSNGKSAAEKYIEVRKIAHWNYY